MSVLANTLHRPAIRGGFSDFRDSSPNSFSMETPSRVACWSKKEPVPAAHIVFMEKSATFICFVVSSCSMSISFESSPPISIIVLASGCRVVAALLCATTSLTKAIFINSDTIFPPVPVIAIPSISSIWVRLNISFKTRRNISTVWPCVRT